jgi:hypothetical protein
MRGRSCQRNGMMLYKLVMLPTRSCQGEDRRPKQGGNYARPKKSRLCRRDLRYGRARRRIGGIKRQVPVSKTVWISATASIAVCTRTFGRTGTLFGIRLRGISRSGYSRLEDSQCLSVLHRRDPTHVEQSSLESWRSGVQTVHNSVEISTTARHDSGQENASPALDYKAPSPALRIRWTLSRPRTRQIGRGKSSNS